MNAEEFHEKKDGIVLDVRTAEEFMQERIPGTRHAPVDTIEQYADIFLKDKEAPIYIHCQHGIRGAQAAKILSQKGYTKVFNLEGGLEAWRSAGFPVER